MDLLGIFFLIVLVSVVIFVNILFRRKLKIKKITDKKIKRNYLIISIISLLFSMFIVVNLQILIEDYLYSQLEYIKNYKTIRLLILYSVVFVYILLQLIIGRIFIKRNDNKYILEDFNYIGDKDNY